MCIVNYWYICDAFAELERAEAEQGHPLGIDPNDEQSVRRAIESYVCPWVRRLKPECRALLMTTLAYFLKKPTFTGAEVFAQVPDLTMGRPDDERRIFEWMWKSLVPGIRYHDIDTSACTEDNDMMKADMLTEGMAECAP